MKLQKLQNTSYSLLVICSFSTEKTTADLNQVLPLMLHSTKMSLLQLYKISLCISNTILSVLKSNTIHSRIQNNLPLPPIHNQFLVKMHAKIFCTLLNSTQNLSMFSYLQWEYLYVEYYIKHERLCNRQNTSTVYILTHAM